MFLEEAQCSLWSLCNTGVIQACFHGGCLLGTILTEFATLGLLWWRSLAQDCYLSVGFLILVPVEVVASGLLQLRLAQGCFCWVPGLGLVLQRVLSCTSSCGGCCLSPVRHSYLASSM